MNFTNVSSCGGYGETCPNIVDELWFRNFFSVYLEVPATRIDEPHYMYARFVFLTLTLSAGLFGNTLTILIMTRPSMQRQQISSRFGTLAFCDLCCCLMRGVIWIGMFYAFLDRPSPLRFSNDHWCKFAEYVCTSLHLAESWMVTFITLERAVVVVFPMKGGQVCGRSSGKYFLFFCVCGPFAALSYIPLVTKYIPGIGCAIRPFPDLMFHFLITTIAISMMPLTLIFICNISIIVALKQQNVKVDSDKRAQKFKRVTNMVLAVSVAFLATVFPQAVNSLMIISHPHWAWLRISNDVAAILLDINYAINFYLYVITGKSMRLEIRHFFGCVS